MTAETPTLVMQHHGNSHCLLCSGMYHQAWGSMVFSSSLAGFLGQPATHGCCTAYWANISLEQSFERMQSLRKATALRCLGGQSKKGGIALYQETGRLCLESQTEYVDGKLATGEDSHPLFSCKSTISCSFPKLILQSGFNFHQTPFHVDPAPTGGTDVLLLTSSNPKILIYFVSKILIIFILCYIDFLQFP